MINRTNLSANTTTNSNHENDTHHQQIVVMQGRTVLVSPATLSEFQSSQLACQLRSSSYLNNPLFVYEKELEKKEK